MINLSLEKTSSIQSPRFQEGHKSIKFKEGDDVKMTFKVLGFPEPLLQFYKNGKKLQNNEVFKIGKIHIEWANNFQTSCRV